MKRTLLTAAAFVGLSQAAEAQAPIERGHNETVTSRARPEYDALGVRVGAFELLPKITFGVESNDNIFATQNLTQDDLIFTVRPEVQVASDWSRHSLRGSAGASTNAYQDFDNQNTTDYFLNGDFRLDVGRENNLGIGGDFISAHEGRTDPDLPAAALEPIEYSVGTIYGYGVYVFNRVRVTGRAEVSEYDYDDAITTGGALLPQQFRDHTETAQTVRVEYALSPSTALVLRGRTTQQEYDVPAPGQIADRDSKSYRIEGGVNADITNLVRGELIVGYVSQEFDNTNFSIDGLAADAKLEYFVTRLTTITLNASRGVQETGVYGPAQGVLVSRGEVRVDHELLRNVLIGGGLGMANDEYEGLDRTDDSFSGNVGVRYLMNRRVEFGARYDYLDVQSDGIDRDRDFTINRLMATITLKL